MTGDEGGWTLLITLAPTTVTWSTFATPNDWPSTFDTTGGPPTKTGMYKGSLAAFHEVREESASGASVIYGKGKSTAEVDTIRNLYGFLSRVRVAQTLAEIPACRETYSAPADSISGCTQGTGTNDTTVLGWARDPPGRTECWFARGNCCCTPGADGGGCGCANNAGCSTAGGSSTCGGDANGTRWARTWFR
jgi:hypothetical protein